MNKVIIVLLYLLINFGCKNYKNKDRYHINIDENVEIYYSTNSCCYYCISNLKKLKHIQVIEKKTIDPGPSDCDGCNYTAAFVFQGKSKGIDTVKLKLVQASMECDSNDVQTEKYIIEVK